ncbi:UMP kinase [Candidatus Bathyarchaeota archaeon]|nr:MAG: UMP kinase [Candidatus Bathyarchaeota archaeon]
MKLVIRFGGSVIASPIRPKLIGEYAEFLKKLRGENHSIVAVTGGGEIARQFIKAARELGLREEIQDELAIKASRLVAELFQRKLSGDACSKIPTSVEEAKKCIDENKIVVMGGLKPGMTTDTVAVLIAKAINADMLVKATDQEGIYTKDPQKHKDAKLLKKVKIEDLEKILEEDKHKAGIHQILDPEAIKILKTLKIRLVVVNGFKPENILLAIKGENIGTLVEV